MRSMRELSGTDLKVGSVIVAARSSKPKYYEVIRITDAGMTVRGEDGAEQDHDFFLAGPRWMQKFLVLDPLTL